MRALFHSADTASTNATSLTQSITVASTNNRLLLVSIAVGPTALGGPPTVSTVDWNSGEALTRIDRILNGGRIRAEMWALVNPTATTANVVITLTGAFAANIVAGYCQLKNVFQGNALRGKNTAQNTSGTASVTVTDSLAIDLGIDSLGVDGAGVLITADSGQTLRATKSVSSGGNTTQLRVSTKRGAATGMTLTYTFGLSTPDWAMVAASLKPQIEHRLLAQLGVGK